jgi:hypothetical protein
MMMYAWKVEILQPSYGKKTGGWYTDPRPQQMVVTAKDSAQMLQKLARYCGQRNRAAHKSHLHVTVVSVSLIGEVMK